MLSANDVKITKGILATILAKVLSFTEIKLQVERTTKVSRIHLLPIAYSIFRHKADGGYTLDKMAEELNGTLSRAMIGKYATLGEHLANGNMKDVDKFIANGFPRAKSSGKGKKNITLEDVFEFVETKITFEGAQHLEAKVKAKITEFLKIQAEQDSKAREAMKQAKAKAKATTKAEQVINPA